MKTLILNEKKYVETLLETGKLEEKPGRDLHLLAEYMYSVLQYRKIRIAKELKLFLKANFPQYQKRQEGLDTYCDNIAKCAGSFKLLEVDSLPITQKELDTIRALKNWKEERVLFVMLVCAKYNHMKNPLNPGWVNQKPIDIFKMAKINTRNDTERAIMLSKFVDAGLIEIPKRQDNINSKVTFMDLEGEPVESLTDLKDLNCEYGAIINPNTFFRCRKCGKMTKIEDYNKGGKLCKSCFEKRKRSYITKTCVDCGQAFAVDTHNKTAKIRCDGCQHKRRMEKQQERRKNNFSC